MKNKHSGEVPTNRAEKPGEVETHSVLTDKICKAFNAFFIPAERRGGVSYIKKGTDWYIPIDTTLNNAKVDDDFNIGLYWDGGHSSVGIPYKVFLAHQGSPVELGMQILAKRNDEQAYELARQEVDQRKADEERKMLENDEKHSLELERVEREAKHLEFVKAKEEEFKQKDSDVRYEDVDIDWLKKLPDLRINVGGVGTIIGVDKVLAGRKWIVGIVFGPDPSNRDGFTSKQSKGSEIFTSKGNSILAIQFASGSIIGPKEAAVDFQVTVCNSDGKKEQYKGKADVKNSRFTLNYGEIPLRYHGACVAVVNEFFWKANRKGPGVSIY